MIAQRVAHYVIVEKLGEGGMGVVYRARDEKLQRDVALKFLGTLPTGSSASHGQVLEEARAISALNHPNICTVYEVGEADGKPYIAMEYVEGRQLTTEIRSTGMALDQVERYGIQLAEALSHAHSRGIIHRDLKAANVMITPSGLLKVLDFGISRRMDKSGGDATTRFDKSWESQHTFTGTLPYVAPEVFKGQEADERSDIWSLGVLLYEMVAGRRPFRGATAYELGAAIMRERPPEIAQPIPHGAAERHQQVPEQGSGAALSQCRRGARSAGNRWNRGTHSEVFNRGLARSRFLDLEEYALTLRGDRAGDWIGLLVARPEEP